MGGTAELASLHMPSIEVYRLEGKGRRSWNFERIENIKKGKYK
jgi:hypothetical protein